MLLDDCISANPLLDQADQVIHRNIFMPSQIEYLEANMLQSKDHTAGNIINIGETARLAAIAIQVQSFALCDPADEPKDRHIWAASWSINGKKAYYAYIDIIEIMIGVGHGLGPLFAGGVRL